MCSVTNTSSACARKRVQIARGECSEATSFFDTNRFAKIFTCRRSQYLNDNDNYNIMISLHAQLSVTIN